MNIETEKELVQKAKTDSKAFGELFDIFYPKLIRYVIWRTGDVEVAQDIVSETFIKALRKLDSFEWRGVSIEAWLYAIATNEIRMHFRGQRRLVSLEELQQTERFEPQDERDLIEELVEAQAKIDKQKLFKQAQNLLQKMPVKYQEAITLRFVNDKKVQEIATILKKPEGTVKSLLSRGLKLLRKQLQMQPNFTKHIVLDEGRSGSIAKEEYER